MSTFKKLPENANDGRYNRPIDVLRAMTWYQFVKCKLGNASNYELNKIFEESQSKWVTYMKGSQPNERLLGLVEKKVQRSREIYESGPKGSKLWVALVSENETELKLIVKHGHSIDQSIAQFRLNVLLKKITVDCYHGKTETHPYDYEIAHIEHQLIQTELLSFTKPVIDSVLCFREVDKLNGEATLVTRLIDLLRESIKPYRKASMDQAYAELVDGFSDQYYDLKWHRDLIEEMAFEDLRMGTVKSKGLKLRASVPPTAPAP